MNTQTFNKGGFANNFWVQIAASALAPAKVATVGAFHLRKSSGSFAIFAAIRRASSSLSSLAAERRPGSFS